MSAFCAKALEKGKGMGSLETVAVGNPSITGAVDPSTVVAEAGKRKEGMRLISPPPPDSQAAPRGVLHLLLQSIWSFSHWSAQAALKLPLLKAPVAPFGSSCE